MRCQSEPLPQIMTHLSLFNHQLMYVYVSGVALAVGCGKDLICSPRRTLLRQSVANLKRERRGGGGGFNEPRNVMYLAPAALMEAASAQVMMAARERPFRSSWRSAGSRLYRGPRVTAALDCNKHHLQREGGEGGCF